MISMERFREKLTNQNELMGWRLTEKRIMLIYEELYTYEPIDLDFALNVLKGFEKFSYIELDRNMRLSQAKRLELEASETRRREEAETRRWFRDHRGSRQACINSGICGECKRIYCDVLNVECSRLIKKVMVGDITGDEMYIQLAGKFKGIGFESLVPGLEPF